MIKQAIFLQQYATVHRTMTTEHSTGLLFLPTTIACCVYITRLGLAEKLWRLAMFIKFRSIRICKTTPDLPSPTNTAVRSQQRLNTPEAQKVSNFYFVNDNLLFDLYFQGGGGMGIFRGGGGSFRGEGQGHFQGGGWLRLRMWQGNCLFKSNQTT